MTRWLAVSCSLSMHALLGRMPSPSKSMSQVPLPQQDSMALALSTAFTVFTRTPTAKVCNVFVLPPKKDCQHSAQHLTLARSIDGKLQSLKLQPLCIASTPM